MVANIVNIPVLKREFGSKVMYVEIACLSSDTKPTEDIATGSMALEADTGDVYVFDEVSEVWNKMCSIKEA